MTHPQLPPGSFYGELSRKAEVADLVLHESRYPPNASLAVHTHAQSYFSVVLGGGYVETCGNRMRECKPAAVLFHPIGEIHSDRFSGTGGRLFHLGVGRGWSQRLKEHPVRLEAPAHFTGGPPTWIAGRLYREFRQLDSLSPVIIEGLALELLAETSRPPQHPVDQVPPGWLRRARELLQDRFSESPSIDFVAHAIGVHPVHLCRTFRRFHGCTIGEFVRRLRIDFACVQLSASRAPLSQIAAEAGYADQSHFTRSFKARIGISPSRYRKESQRQLPGSKRG